MDKSNEDNDIQLNKNVTMCVCEHCKKEMVGVNNGIIFDFLQKEIKWSCGNCGEQNLFRGWSEFRSHPFPRIRTQR